MISELSTTPIQHWLNTPYGAYEGYPTYGNAFEDLLFQNLNDVDIVTGKIMDKMLKDLGFNVMKNVESLDIISTDEEDTIMVLLFLKDGSLGGYTIYNKG